VSVVLRRPPPLLVALLFFSLVAHYLQPYTTHSLTHSLSWCSHDRERLPSPVIGDNMLPPSLTHSLTHSLLLLLLLLLSATASLTHTHDRGVPSVFPRAEMHLQLGFDLSLSAAADQSREQCFRFLPNAPFQGE
jgi:hypothetical protein